MESKSIGQQLIEKSKSPFLTDDVLASWIDHEINRVEFQATFLERRRIEKKISTMTEDEIIQTWKRLRQEFHVLQDKESL